MIQPQVTNRDQRMNKKWNVQNKNIWSGYEELYAKGVLRTYVRRYNYTEIYHIKSIVDIRVKLKTLAEKIHILFLIELY